MICNKRTEGLVGLFLTVLLASIFTSLQAYEYSVADFKLSDGIYGATFYMATGFHGFHVFVGTIFLIVCTVRLFQYQLTQQHHFGFEAAA
jgi:cytochrome c oxidase subunit 3